MTIRFVTPVVFNKLIRVQCINLSNTTLFDGRDISSIYYIRYSYMFRRLTMTILRLYMGYLLLYVRSEQIRHVPTPPNLHDTYEISCPPQLLPPHCIQPILSLV